MGHLILRRPQWWTEGPKNTKEAETGGREELVVSSLDRTDPVGRTRRRRGFSVVGAVKAQAQQVSPTVGLCQLSPVLPRVTKNSIHPRTHTHPSQETGATVGSESIHTLLFIPVLLC